MILDTIDNWRNRFQGEPWVTIFSKLETFGPDSPDGRFEIMGDDAFGGVASYPTRERADAICETHQRKIDIQMCLKGSERIEWAPRGTLPVKTAYDPEKDAEFYAQPAEPLPGGVDMKPGYFMVLFPEDAHMPALKPTDGTADVRKLVVKLSVDAVKKY
ncbi:YhcH/YjgK/YiaL family protein [bacterium]|nr:YhcH/YjgK/YiaL family protein [bacterium]